eukprot:Sdes_comp18916_c1_seq1m9377
MPHCLKIGYWDIRGLAEPIRRLAYFHDYPLESVDYAAVACEDGTFDRSSWTDVKNELGFSFPNLPYLIDETNGTKLTQSSAIIRYVSRLIDGNLLGRTDKDKCVVEMLQDTICDLRTGWVNLCYRTYHEDKLPYLERVQANFFAKFERWLSEIPDGDYLMGKSITYVDFMFYEYLEGHNEMYAGILDQFPHISRYFRHFEKLPKILSYKKTQKQRPYNNIMAQYGAHLKASRAK